MSKINVYGWLILIQNCTTDQTDCVCQEKENEVVAKKILTVLTCNAIIYEKNTGYSYKKLLQLMSELNKIIIHKDKIQNALYLYRWLYISLSDTNSTQKRLKKKIFCI